MKNLIEIIEGMKTSTVQNYVVAGLDSSLLGNGLVRYFECSRNHQDQITPHSHRFDFACIVLEGRVMNRIWSKNDGGDLFQISQLIYNGDIGEHTKELVNTGYFGYTDHMYFTGQHYSMKADEIHSIQFSKGAKVLFFEAENKSDVSIIIEPVVNGKLIETYKKLDYMFLRER